ncbi:sulfate transport system permease protein cysW [Candidatus Blochmanniella vafra str. BVAF]|uniref:Sulfate transport system permease protein cysW n=1 Tax=Blochmanniella vafra (strain BVAF) TaxID=859654 RepID=E8Q771_BLOVB|nr:sulfate ABC transporter permease subunit [Candidatus Blochmannia vafer]ADV33895.1 sulfate transport system permease protein cysW [Candidatus Blochmannia vafer str. BVAF]
MNSNFFSSIEWGKWILIIFSVSISIILLFIPLIMIFISALSAGLHMVVLNLLNTDMIHAVLLTVIVALIVIPVNVVFGIFMAWLITRFNFFGKQFLLAFLSISVAVSPVVVGLLYLLCYSNGSIIGDWLDSYNIQIMFSWIGIVLVTICITCPFVANELIPVMINQGNQEDEAAVLLGASGWKMFWYVTFPNIRWALLCGIIITNARAMGEFGASSIVSGLIRGETYTLPLYIELLYQDYNIVGAFIAASLLALVSIIMLFIKNYFKYYYENNM